MSTAFFEWRYPNYKSTHWKSSSCQKHNLWDNSKKPPRRHDYEKQKPITEDVESWGKILTFQNMGIITSSSHIEGCWFFLHNSKEKFSQKWKALSFTHPHVLSHPYDAISCALWAWQPLNTVCLHYVEKKTFCWTFSCGFRKSKWWRNLNFGVNKPFISVH